MRNTMACCFGTVPNMNEWVVVKMKKGVQPTMDVPVEFYGELKVGAMFENGYMTGLYELEGEDGCRPGLARGFLHVAAGALGRPPFCRRVRCGRAGGLS